jgi:o-succinylbenzoate---CoA ligase
VPSNAGKQLVALLYAPGPDLVAAMDRVWEVGDAVLPLDHRLRSPEVAEVLRRLRPARLVEPAGSTELEDSRPVEAGVAAVVLTSGSSGIPKGVELTHTALDASTRAVARRLGVDRHDRWLCCLPPARIGGLSVIVRSSITAREPVVHRGFDPDAIARERSATLVSLVPTMLARLLEARVRLDRFKAILLGGAPAPAPLLACARRAGARVVVTYGMTETCGGCVYDGVPLDGVDVAVGARRTVALRGPMVMARYRLEPRMTARALRDGWFHSQDVGAIDGAGRLAILGRADEVIVTGGEKVAPAEVVRLLQAHPRVADAVVFGRKDETWGQRVVAVVTPPSGVKAPTLEELRAFVGARAAAYKAPREVLVSRTPTS